MADLDYKRTIDRLTEKTISKKAIWNKEARDGEFSISFSKGSFVIDKWFSDDDQREEYDFAVYNASGDQIYYSGKLGSSNILFRSLTKLHDAVIRSYYAVDETMGSFEQEIQSDGIIGKRRQAPSNPFANDDDDPPF